MNAFELCIVKVTAFCNIDCSYCYMFNAADHTHERVPRTMSEAMALRLLDRIRDYLDAGGRRRFHLTLHGGEPSLWPLPAMRGFLERVRALNAEGYHLTVSMQTNAFRYDERLFALLAEHGVSVGVSIDGPREFNDRRRVTHRGAGSYDRVMGNVERILGGPGAGVFQGFLAVADPTIAPAAFVDWAAALPVTRLDLLWPMDFSHLNPPWDDGDEAAYRAAPRFGHWFAAVFDAWMAKDDPDLHIRHFYDCIAHYLGSTRHIESIVNDGVPMFVVNTDGAYEYHDYLRPHADGACRTGANATDHPISVLHDDPLFRRLLALAEHLPADCAGCDVRAVCGGGFLPGRTGAPGMPRSVLCHDQGHFFAHVSRTLARLGVPPAEGRAAGTGGIPRPLLGGRVAVAA
ncbi:MAG: hypothetical protein ABS99_08925 [Acetobacteraceae bacterium SCN 69-10]|nr:radical SAM protein [Rhodospirillales bacterium]ODU54680.1 MAG: hypothetical protein ABS99_08925 [Acetobacteraceae bacterium SCN 69-10]OJY70397.1 MAG: hypothetical protein BGP12_21910 [Rhodospirillales bacterium 70-18]